jgi:hypothetical protein
MASFISTPTHNTGHRQKGDRKNGSVDRVG